MLKIPFMLFVLICVCTVLTAGEMSIGPQDSGFLDSEASTNVAFNIWRNDVRMFEVHLAWTSSVSNGVQVAFGRDADGDGDLAPEETGLVLGWRAGRYFVEDVARESRIFAPDVVADGAARFLHMNVATDAAFVPRRAVFANDAGACFADVSAACPPWLFSREWNLFKVTRRGPVASGEFCRIRNDYRSFWISFR